MEWVKLIVEVLLGLGFLGTVIKWFFYQDFVLN